jgi:hypothetical protein
VLSSGAGRRGRRCARCGVRRCGRPRRGVKARRLINRSACVTRDSAR